MPERISINPKVCHGQACIKGTRIPVHQIFRMLANGDSIESLIRAYPSLQREDVLRFVQGDFTAPDASQMWSTPA